MNNLKIFRRLIICQNFFNFKKQTSTLSRKEEDLIPELEHSREFRCGRIQHLQQGHESGFLFPALFSPSLSLPIFVALHFGHDSFLILTVSMFMGRKIAIGNPLPRQKERRRETERKADNFSHLFQLKRTMEDSGSFILGRKTVKTMVY